MTVLSAVQLRDLTLEDLETVFQWSRDTEFCLANGWTLELSQKNLRSHWMQFVRKTRSNFLRKAITFNNQLVGYADLADINQTEARASLGYAIGCSNQWGQGLGSSGARLMLEVAFLELQLERVVSDVNAANSRSIRVLEKLGFKLEGVLRNHETYRGERGDVHLFGLLREEFLV